ncbi:hypothetical protein WDH52_16025 [Streptomyces sp. TRM70308]|uniref:hypothetical protein n=1 Tax=Streptomyces sp. TRM70308 TaxID=3131932 RepID=UPI003D07E4B4
MPRLADRVHPVLTGEGGALLDAHHGRWTYLTPTAAAALAVLLTTDDMHRAVAEYAARYGLSPRQAADDLTGLWASLTHRGLTAVTPPRGRRRLRRWWR